MTQPELIMLVGIPACGKSTLTKKYREQGYYILSSDEIRLQIAKEQCWEPYDQSILGQLNGMVFEYIRKTASALLKDGKNVVLDATNLGRKKRKNLLSHLNRTHCKKICVFFIIHKDICIARNKNREGYARVPDDSMETMLRNFEAPYYWEGWDEIIPIINDTPYQFPMEETKSFNQDNPHHTKTLFEHMDSAYQYGVENNYPDYILKVLKYHDIGKYYTKAFLNRRGETTEIAHYYGHENYGAYIYLTEMCCGKDLTKEEFDQILYEANLINCHMRPLNIWRDSPNAKKNDKELFGEKFIEEIMLINQADRFAH